MLRERAMKLARVTLGKFRRRELEIQQPRRGFDRVRFRENETHEFGRFRFRRLLHRSQRRRTPHEDSTPTAAHRGRGRRSLLLR